MIKPIHQLHKTTNNLHKDKSKPIPKLNHRNEILEILNGIEWDLDNIREPKDRIKSKLELIRYHLENI